MNFNVVQNVVLIIKSVMLTSWQKSYLQKKTGKGVLSKMYNDKQWKYVSCIINID